MSLRCLYLQVNSILFTYILCKRGSRQQQQQQQLSFIARQIEGEIIVFLCWVVKNVDDDRRMHNGVDPIPDYFFSWFFARIACSCDNKTMSISSGKKQQHISHAPDERGRRYVMRTENERRSCGQRSSSSFSSSSSSFGFLFFFFVVVLVVRRINRIG